jgi:hypothetical protein
MTFVYVIFIHTCRLYQMQIASFFFIFISSKLVISIDVEYFALIITTFTERSYQSHYDPGVDSASNTNEYQKSFWG